MFKRLVLKPHCPQCPSVLLKYTLPAFFSGEIYQLPHRSFAIRGNPWLEATFWTKPESCTIEFSLLLVESVERLSAVSVREGFCEARGRRRDEVEVGRDEGSVIERSFSQVNAEAA